MTGYIDKIKEIAGRILEEKKVDGVIGFTASSLPLMPRPYLAVSPSDVDKFIWNSNCGLNLANYITDRKDRIGIVAKGCDSRNIVTHIIENKIKRDQLYIIGVPCTGMIDRHRIAAVVKGDITEILEQDGEITVKGADFEQMFNKADFLAPNCAVCIHRNPVIYDELVGAEVEEQTGIDRFAEVTAIENMAPDEKWAWFDDLLAGCIRCYACRNACPLCYCPTCFVDESKPQWVGKGQDPVDVRTFHFLRAYHCAGRCTDCGACVRACPMAINVRAFTKKLEKDCFELYEWEAGLSTEQRPSLDTYRPDDPGDFL